ncbi:MAG: carboxypeptidase regulatory-like domain-containing protein [Oligoflexia bacterium]|nr:carboxypeptidase regulatory-like domain-containing protein [Oligoflexia bacterium]
MKILSLVCITLVTLLIFSCADQSKFSVSPVNNLNSNPLSTPTPTPTSTPTTITTGSISGIVSDASNGNAINSATLYISADQATTQTFSAANGTYTISNINSGTQTLVVEKIGYVSQNVQITITPNQTLSNSNVSLMTAAFSSDKYVITLTWGSSPTDLDSHLLVPASPDFHLYYQNKGSATLDASPFAYLDVDDTTGFGPETIRIKKSGNAPYYNNLYKYYVYQFTNNEGESLITSSAIVRIYNDSTLIKSYNVPTSGSGRYWYVFDLDGSGNITDNNIIQNAAPTL